MVLTTKYASLIDLLNALKVDELDVREDNDVLYISGTTQSVDVKHKVWDLYNRIDPNYISEDLVLELAVLNDELLKEATVNCGNEPFVAVRRGPDVNQPIIAELQNGDKVYVLGMTNQNWCLVKTIGDQQGYCYIDYLFI